MCNLSTIKIYLLENRSWLTFLLFNYLSSKLFKDIFKVKYRICCPTRLQDIESEHGYG